MSSDLTVGHHFSITMWYKRHECGLRISIFFSAATAAGAFGGLLARGIIEMEGLGGLNGWAWIFIIEGLATFVVGKLSCFSCFRNHISSALEKMLTPDCPKQLLRHTRSCMTTPTPPDS